MNGLKREGMNGDRHEETRLTHWTNRPIKRPLIQYDGGKDELDWRIDFKYLIFI